MQDRAIIKESVEKIKKIKDPLQAISELADLTFYIGTDACNERRQLGKQIEGLRLVLSGNGDPSKSLLAKVEIMNDCFSKMERDLSIIKNVLIGSMDAVGTHGGIIQRLEELETKVEHEDTEIKEIKGGMTKVMWVVVLAVLGQILAGLFL